eukprot:jgi/Mesvir1/22124/Mv18727-RA.1
MDASPEYLAAMPKKSSASSSSASAAPKTSTPLPPSENAIQPESAPATTPVDAAATPVAEVETAAVVEETAKESDGEPPSKKPKKDPIRSTRMPDMTVGEVRKMLNYIRRNSATIRSDTALPNGMQAGEFSIRYLAGTPQKEGGTKE